MKDITISARQIRREIGIWGILLLVAVGINIYAIIRYEAPWKETLTSLGYVLVLSVVLYLIAGLFRLLFFIIKKVIKKPLA